MLLYILLICGGIILLTAYMARHYSSDGTREDEAHTTRIGAKDITIKAYAKWVELVRKRY